MTFLAPLFLLVGAAAAGGIVLLHFLARQRPRPAILPTARFVPDDPARWPSRAPRPTDWLLLTLRVLAIVVIATAFAQPVRTPERVVTTRVVLVDRSRAIGDERTIRDSALSVLRAGDVMIAFDTTAITYAHQSRDSAATLARSNAPPSLTVGLIAAERAALDLREIADSLELVIVSSFADAAWDAATPGLRARWQGRVRLVHVPLAGGDTTMLAVEVRGPSFDPAGAAVARFALAREPTARIVRGPLLAADSAWGRAGPRVLIHWPIDTGETAVTAQAVVAGDLVLAAPLVRRTLARGEGTSVIARFADGSPAVVERTHGNGCIREVAFDFPRAGDVPLRESSRRMAAVLAGPCSQHATYDVMGPARLDSVRGQGRLFAASALPRPPERRSSARAWLLMIGALLLLAEVAARRRIRST